MLLMIVFKYNILYNSILSVLSLCEQFSLQKYTNFDNCFCDLSPSICDLNCCCDIDCNQICTKQSKEMYMCGEGFNNILCIYQINYKSILYYPIPEKLCARNDAIAFTSSYEKFPFNYKELNSISYSTNYYKMGDPIQTKYIINDKISYGLLSLPATLHACIDNPISFLENSYSSCFRLTEKNFLSSCVQNSFTDYQSYFGNFSILQKPLTNADTNQVNSINIEPTKFGCLNDNGYIENCFEMDLKKIPSVNLSNDICYNVMTRVDYKFKIWNLTIVTVSMEFQIGNIKKNMLPLKQYFSAKFQLLKLDENGTFINNNLQLSGNPGYLLGKQVLSGILSEGNTLLVSLNNNNWLTMAVSNSASGFCEESLRQPVLFGINMRSGCFIRCNYSNISQICAEISHYLSHILLPGSDPPTHVAKFGNSSFSNIKQEWVPIQSNLDSLNPVLSNKQDGCTNMITGLDIQITYMKVGLKQLPQNQIVQVFFNYKIQDSFVFKCLDSSTCSDDTTYGEIKTTEKFEIVSSVSFIDVTSGTYPFTGETMTNPVSISDTFFNPF